MTHHDGPFDLESPPPPDPTLRPTTAEAYGPAHRTARAVLNATGSDRAGFGMDPDHADRLVSLVLGAALLELETPWRHRLEEAQAEVGSHADAFDRMQAELDRTREQRDRAQAAYRHVSDVESEQRSRANAAEADVDAARNLAVRLEGELAHRDDLLAEAARILADVGNGDRLERLETLLDVNPYTGRAYPTDPPGSRYAPPGAGLAADACDEDD